MSQRTVECSILSPERALFLKSIDLVGFKSFARSTRIELPPGITAFVGPNGSGKSNVVDAIRWCLGEQSMRDLRGQRVEDVIYSGTRRVMGFAEVTLTLETDERDGPAGSAGLSIGRRVHRSGDSDYILNGERVRLRDVSSALRDIDIDAGRYVVVNQGMADALLVASPAERRMLLEHAAGLSGYRAHREETRQKLASTAQNVLTIETVLAELEPRVRLLRRQARAVRDRDEAAGRLRTRLVQWYAFRWSETARILTRIDAEEETARAMREGAVATVRGMEEATETWLEAERAFQQRIETARAAMHATEREVDAARFHLQQATDRLEGAEKSKIEGVEQTERLARVRAETIATLVEAERSLAAAEAEKEQRSTSEAEARERLAALRASSAETASRHADLSARREDLERRHARRREELRVAQAALQQQEEARLASGERLAASSVALDELIQRFEERALQLQGMEEALVGAQEEAERTRLEVEAASARLQRLEQIRARLRGVSSHLGRRRDSEARSLVALGEFARGGILPQLQVPEGWELAAAAALGAWDSAPLEGFAEGWGASEIAAFVRWRDALLPAVGSRGSWADQIVGAVPKAPTPLHSTVFVDGESDAQEIWRRLEPLQAHTIGTPPIQVISKSGVIRSALGVVRESRDDRAARYLVGRREMVRIDRRLSRTRSRLERLEGTIGDDRRYTDDVSERRRSELAEQDRLQRERDDVEGALRQAERDRWRIEAEQSAIAQNEERSAAQLSRLHESIERLEAERNLLSVELRDVSGEADAIGGELAELKIEVDAATSGLDARRRALGDVTVEEGREAQSYAALRRELDRLRFEERHMEEKRLALDAETERLSDDVQAARETLIGLEAISQEHVAHVRAIEAERPEGRGPIPDLGEARRRLSDALAVHERVLAQQEQRRMELDGLRAEIERELDMPPESLAHAEQDGDVPTEEEIRRLRSRATQYAGADESVLRELEEIEERYTKLSTHLEDLQIASSELQEIMATADAEMNRRFSRAFDAVNSEFGRVFRVMLQGGEARLEQVDSDGGIGVRAQLPGKRAQSSAAFSGGEKALVASSLLFGVLNIRPTPFCVLDEVDAALDESNVDRYLAALRDISARTQVIVVTHNRATMAAADVLYGVTMDDDGATSLLSLRLDAYEAAG